MIVVEVLREALAVARVSRARSLAPQLHNLNEQLRKVALATADFSRSTDLLETLECIGTRTAELLDCAAARVLILEPHAGVFRCLQLSQVGPSRRAACGGALRAR